MNDSSTPTVQVDDLHVAQSELIRLETHVDLHAVETLAGKGALPQIEPEIEIDLSTERGAGPKAAGTVERPHE